MRMWAYLREPQGSDNNKIYKIMLYQTEDESTYVFLYTSKDAIMGSYDEWYENLASALESWNDNIDDDGWHQIDDPLPDCQDDAFLPIRIKGRNIGKPVFGKFEILKDGIWVDYYPE